MPIEFVCEKCQNVVRTPDSAAGKKGRCPICQAVVQIPLANGESPIAASTPAVKSATATATAVASESIVVTCPNPHCRQQMAATRAMVGQLAPCPYCRTIIPIAVGGNTVATSTLRSIFDDAPIRPGPSLEEAMPPKVEKPAYLAMYSDMLRKAVGIQHKSTAAGRTLCMIAGILAMADALVWFTIALRFGGVLALVATRGAQQMTSADWEKWGLTLLYTSIGPAVPAILGGFSGYFLFTRENWMLSIVTAALSVVARFAFHSELSAMMLILFAFEERFTIAVIYREPIYITWIMITVTQFFLVAMPVTRQEFPEDPNLRSFDS